MKKAAKLKQFLFYLNNWRAVLLIAPSVAAFIVVLRVLGLFQMLEWAALDQFFRLRPPEPPDSRIAIVFIDEATIRNLGQWPLSDAVLAKLLKKIRASQPRVIGLDLYRDLPVQPGHQELVEVMKSTPNLMGIQKVVGDGHGPEVNPPPTLSQQSQIAASDLVLDADAKLRRGLLSLESKSGQEVLSLAASLSLIYLECQGIELQELNSEQRHYQLGKATFIPFGKNDGGYVNADDKGYQILLNFRGRQDRFQMFSMQQVIDGQVPKDWARDRVVLIGATAASLHDDFFTPYSSSLSAFPERMPGVVIHANLVSHILSAALDGRSMMRVLPEVLEWMWIFSGSFVGAILSWTVHSEKIFKRRITRRKTVVIIALAASILILSSYLLFLLGWWITAVPPLFALGGSASVITIYINHLVRLANAQLALYSQEINLLNDNLKTENLRIAAELDVTRHIQQMMLPKDSELAQIEGLEIAGFMEPAAEVGGDYYDVIKSGKRVKICIGDVTGHGLESGVLMIMVQTAVRTLLEGNFSDPKSFLEILNRTIYNNAQRMNCDKNMTLALLDYSNGVFQLSGQHEEVIIVRSHGEVELIDTVDLGFPIALVENISDFVASTEVQLHSGDVVVLYTDGITEALDINKSQYGLDRLVELVRQNYQRSAMLIKQAVIEDVRRHIGKQKVYDDITILVIKKK